MLLRSWRGSSGRGSLGTRCLCPGSRARHQAVDQRHEWRMDERAFARACTSARLLEATARTLIQKYLYYVNRSLIEIKAFITTNLVTYGFQHLVQPSGAGPLFKGYLENPAMCCCPTRETSILGGGSRTVAGRLLFPTGGTVSKTRCIMYYSFIYNLENNIRQNSL